MLDQNRAMHHLGIPFKVEKSILIGKLPKSAIWLLIFDLSKPAKWPSILTCPKSAIWSLIFWLAQSQQNDHQSWHIRLTVLLLKNHYSLYLYENKLECLYHHLIYIFYHQSRIIKSCKHHKYQFYAAYSEFFSFCVSLFNY